MAKKKHTSTEVKAEKLSQEETVRRLGDRINVAAMHMEWLIDVLTDEIDEMDECKAFQKVVYAPRLQGRVHLAMFLAGTIERELKGEGMGVI